MRRRGVVIDDLRGPLRQYLKDERRSATALARDLKIDPSTLCRLVRVDDQERRVRPEVALAIAAAIGRPREEIARLTRILNDDAVRLNGIPFRARPQLTLSEQPDPPEIEAAPSSGSNGRRDDPPKSPPPPWRGRIFPIVHHADPKCRAKSDGDRAQLFAAKLQIAGLRPWLDVEPEDLPDWPRTIADAIRAAAAVLVLLSEESALSLTVQNHLGMAMFGGVHMLVVRLSADVEIPENLRNCEVLNFSQEDCRPWPRLFSTLRRCLPPTDGGASG
jgi:hypothetical protein